MRAGASPSQKGIVGGTPAASRTRTTPGSTLRICHEWVPSRNMSPAIDSIGPVLVDRADQRVVGLGQHPVVAVLGDGPAGRDRRQAGALAARTSPLTASRWTYAPRRPRPVVDAVGDQLEHLVELGARSARGTGPLGGRARRARRCSTPGRPTSATICCAAMSSGQPGELDRVEAARRAPRRAARCTRPARRGSAG